MYNEKEAAYEKHRLRMFWTRRWQYKKIYEWENILSDFSIAESAGWLTMQEKKKRGVILWKDALIKMTFDKRLSISEASNIFDMLFSNDKESRSLALMILQRKKKNIFLKG